MLKNITKYFIFLLTLILLIFLLRNYNFTHYIRLILPTPIKNIIYGFIDFDFKKFEKKKYTLRKNFDEYSVKIVKLELFSNKTLNYSYYLNQNDNNIFLATKTGRIFFLSKKQLFNQKKITLKIINSNLKKIIGEEYIEDVTNVVKGILIVNQKIYISYIDNNNGCYTNAIVAGDLNTKKIYFSPFIKIDECNYRQTIQVGGNMQYFKNNKILLTTGDHESYELGLQNNPQNKNSYYGKILSIDLTTKNIDVLSMGHRNPQGLFYDIKSDIVFSTDHGPQGGDEINVDINPNRNLIKNYGWAISSYGEHYGFPEGESERIKNDINLQTPLYKVAPLNKSHKEYNFEEPIKFFTPAIGITQILRVSNSTNKDYKLLVGSMGFDKEEDDMTVHILNFNSDFKETKYEKIYIGERIRDMIDLNNGFVLMSLEPNGSLGLLENIY
tara:strand:- start:83 stop:1405 length:1323 start_codon:yes stop_codon:yes gene_type:complete